ncbi:MAG: hypothetical protein SFU98_12515 [Leptospiraceae bacterium]|nr:hypothetical protein [Leptospiraceae bacterium]
MLWNTQTEISFFENALKNFASPEQLFYNLSDKYYAYIPKGKEANGQTLQSRNSLIGSYTENWCKNLFEPIAKKSNLFAINGAVCEEIGLTKQSPGDLVITDLDSKYLKAENIKIIFEIKMSIVSNYEYSKSNNEVKYLGDFKQHKGNPSLLRSDSMLKAIGKSINIRVSGLESSKIPIIVLGNSPITESYSSKVDFLKSSGVIQGFWSLNSKPSETEDYILFSQNKSFITIKDEKELKNLLTSLIAFEMNFFSSMLPKSDLGNIIKISSEESNDVARAEKFLSLIRG